MRITFSAGRTSAFDDSLAQQRRSLLKNQSLLNTGWPLAVHEYFDGKEPCDLVAVAQWAIEQNQRKLFQRLQEHGFQGPVPVSDLNQARLLYEVAGPGLAVELQLQHEMDAGKVGELIAFLQRPDVKVSGLWLNLAPTTHATPLCNLLSAVDALPSLTELKILVDGRSEGPVPPSVRWALANSKACMTLSAAARSLILIEPASLKKTKTHLDARATRTRAEEIQREAEVQKTFAENLQALGQTDPSQRPACVAQAADRRRDAEKCRLEAKDMHAKATALEVAPVALQAFLDMNLTSDAFVDALARFARNYLEDGLLCAVRVLAPDYVMSIREKLPSKREMEVLARCQVPCSLKFVVVPSMIGRISPSMRGLKVVGLTLLVLQDFDPVDTRNLLKDIARMPPVDILIRSEEPLPTSEGEIAGLMLQTRKNRPAGDIRLEHFSPAQGWQSYLHVDFGLGRLAETFLSLPLPKLPSDIATHMVNIGALSARDIPALMAVRSETHSTWGQISRAQSATFILLDLSEGRHDVPSLRKSLALSDGSLDQALVNELGRQLDRQQLRDEAAIEMLTAAVEPRE